MTMAAVALVMAVVHVCSCHVCICLLCFCCCCLLLPVVAWCCLVLLVVVVGGCLAGWLVCRFVALLLLAEFGLGGGGCVGGVLAHCCRVVQEWNEQGYTHRSVKTMRYRCCNHPRSGVDP